MASQLVILAIHGIGDQTADYADDLKQKLKMELRRRGVRRYGFHFAYYQDLFQEQQDALWERVSAADMGLKRTRGFALKYFGDALSYQYRSEGRNSLYRQVHDRLRVAIAEANEDLNEGGSLVILAQSFGAHVLSNYIWDLQRGTGIWERGRPRPQDRLGSLKLLITTGCNIPLFASGVEKIEAFDKPNDDFTWINFYDRRDPLGWPLKPLSRDFENSYDNVVTADVPVGAGLPVRSHLNYWRKGRMIWQISHAALKYTGIEEQLRNRRRRRR
ncbi:MAG: hypothetical protein ACLFO1_03165 [Spirochaetaceae bacterium]